VTDTTDMLAVHDCLRHEFARLPITVKAVAEGDADRAAVVGGHVLLMTDFLHVHHSSEDAIVWPLLKERSPEHDALVVEMEEQHAHMHSTVATVRAQAEAWIASPGIQERSALHTTLIALEREILHHFALEEQEVLPLIQRDLTPEEWFSVGEHSRATFTPEDLAVVLGLILDNTSVERGEAILADMPPEARAGFDQFGRPAYAAYKAKITDY
jgi:iron-sulfur cluster repair protein YtfE (RIC family)